jgi:hypothetical protein
MGSILYQGPYTPQPGNYYANYTVTVPQSFIAGPASLNVINFFMVGVSVFAPCACEDISLMGLGIVRADRGLFERERHRRHCLRVWLANRIMDLLNWQRVTRTYTEWTFV